MSEPKVFANRQTAGRELAVALEEFREEKPIILGMPRGGVILAFEIAQALNASLDVMVARKIGAPNQPEYAIGAIAPGDIVVINPEAVAFYDISSPEVQAVIAREKQEMLRRIKLYRGSKPELELKNRTVILVDDGLATGQSALAAVLAIKKMQPKKVILAVGVCAVDSAAILRQEVDELVCLSMPEQFYAVGLWYQDFSQTTDDEVIALLNNG